MVALRPAVFLVAGLAVIPAAFGATFGWDPARPATAEPPAGPEDLREAPRAPRLAQAETPKSASEDEAFRSMTSDAVEAVRNFGKPPEPEEILSANVVDAIRDLDRATDPEASASSREVEEAAENLRAAIREIVKHADERGKTEDYVLKLIEEAVASSGSEVPLALLGADGNLDTAMLVQSVVGRSLESAEADADADYLAALRGEAATTARRTGPGASGGREQTASRAVPAKIEASPETRPATVVIGPGDTLGGIAWKFYGDALAYVKIFEANRDRLQSPDLIYVGAKLRLP
ncbi:MAG: LysM peptidoglycan-binding domain-containing protein [Kiloniellales bacterium]|nr:LysM peptidoglycan-binding domain-containing protein [Kiloniellales bacterium]